MANNFTPFTQSEIKSIMAKRHVLPERKELTTPEGFPIYMMTYEFNNRGQVWG